MPLPHEVTDNFVRLSQDNQVISKLDRELAIPYTFSKGGNMCMLLTNVKKGLNIFTVYYDGIGASDTSDSTLIDFPSEEIPSDNLVVEYTMEESTISGTTLSDSSGNELDSTLIGNPVRYGNALSFNGSTSQYIAMPVHSYAGFSGFSVSFWAFDKRKNESYIKLFSSMDGSNGNIITFEKRQADGFTARFSVNTREVEGSAIRYWNWVLYTATVGADLQFRIYKDDVQLNTAVGTLPAIVDRVKSYIAVSYYGNIGRFRIYDRPLSLDEITVLSKEGYGDTDLPLHKYPKFWKEESGTWIVDEQSFGKRKKFSVVSTENSEKAIICVPRERFSAETAIRVMKRNDSHYNLPTISTAVSSITSIQPKDGDFNFRNEAFNSKERLTGKIEKDGINVESTSTAHIGFLTNVQTQNAKVVIDWVRARNFAKKEPIQLKKEDAGILVTKVATNWYHFNTAQEQVADKTSIDLAITNAPTNFGQVSEKKWLKFPKTTNFNTNLPFDLTLHK